MSLQCPWPASPSPLPACPRLGRRSSALALLTQGTLSSCCGPCFLRPRLRTPGARPAPQLQSKASVLLRWDSLLVLLLEVPEGTPVHPCPGNTPPCRPCRAPRSSQASGETHSPTGWALLLAPRGFAPWCGSAPRACSVICKTDTTSGPASRSDHRRSARPCSTAPTGWVASPTLGISVWGFTCVFLRARVPPLSTGSPADFGRTPCPYQVRGVGDRYNVRTGWPHDLVPGGPRQWLGLGSARLPSHRSCWAQCKAADEALGPGCQPHCPDNQTRGYRAPQSPGRAVPAHSPWHWRGPSHG